MTSKVNISLPFENVVTAVSNELGYAVNFEFANWLEVSRDFTLEKQARGYKSLSYPCIVVHSDIDEESDKFGRFDTILKKVMVYVITDKTKITDKTRKRLEDVYPKLLNIQKEFHDQIQESKEMSLDLKNYKHKKLYFLGSDKNQNQLNDVIDAIEIELTDLKIVRNDCI